MRPGSTEQPGFDLRWALGLSVLIHVVFLLLSVWFPLVGTSSVPLEPPEEQITFSFADALPDERISPFDEPPPARSDPPTEPVPSLPAEGLDPHEPQENEPRLTPPDRIEDPRPKEFEADSAESPGRQDPSALDPPPDEDAQVAAAGEAGSDEPSLDLRAALDEFRNTARSLPNPARFLESAARPPSNLVMPDLAELPATGSGLGPLRFESTDYDWKDYGTQVSWAIWKAWHRRLWSTVADFERWAEETQTWHLDQFSDLRFVIERHGDVTGIVLERPSGCVPLDDSASEALAEVVLPPLPSDFPRDREVVHGRFIAQLPIFQVSRRVTVCRVGLRGETVCDRITSDTVRGLDEQVRKQPYMRENLKALWQAGYF